MTLVWRINLTPQAQKDLAKLDKGEARRICKFLQERVAPDPTAHGKPLKGNLSDFWCWRVENYRILAKIENEELLVLVVLVAHRSKVYGGH